MGNVFGDLLNTLVQRMDALRVVGYKLRSFGSSNSGNCCRRFKIRLFADHLLDVEPQASRRLREPSQDAASRFFGLLNQQRCSEIQSDEAVVGEPNVGATVQRVDRVAVKQRVAQLGLCRQLGSGALKQDFAFKRLERGHGFGGLRYRKSARDWNGRRGHQRGNKDFAGLNAAACAVFLTFECVQEAFQTLDTVLLAWNRNDLAR